MDDRHLRALIGERHPMSSPTALQRAEGYLTEPFKVLGLEVSSHPFKALGDTYRNVIGTRPAVASALGGAAYFCADAPHFFPPSTKILAPRDNVARNH
jgi:hypothetical protein